MRINYLILENWIGIWNGLNRTRIEIDFTKDINGEFLNDNKVTMLVGANGSAKTTILSALHPFMGSQDGRTNLILPDNEGYKEIHIQDNDDYYIIKHFYKKQNKSYISLNDEELNPNGNVTSFKSIVKEYLGVDEDYFKIGRIGTNVTNFIDFTTGDRKKYISKFLPNIDEYLEAYRIVCNKFRELKKEIKFVSDQIDKYDSKENLEITNNSILSQINFRKLDLEESKKKININTGKIDQLDQDKTLQKSGNPFKELFKGSEKKLISADNKLNMYFEKYPQLEKYSQEKVIENLNKSESGIYELSVDISSIEEKISSTTSDIVSLEENLKKKVNVLEEIQEGESIPDLELLLNNKKDELKVISNEIQSKFFKFKKYANVSYNALNSVKFVISGLKENLIRIKYDYSEDIIEEVIKLVEKNNNSADIDTSLKRLKKVKKTIEDEISKLNTHLTILNSNLSKVDILKNRPSICRIDSCSFIRDALKYKDVDKQITEKEIQISKEKKNLDKQNELIEVSERIKNAFSILESAYLSTASSISLLLKLPCSFEVSDFRSFSLALRYSNTDIEKIFNVDSLLKFLENKEQYDIKKKEIDNVNEKLKILNSQASVLDGIEDEISKLSDSIESKEKSLLNLKKDKKDKEELKTKLELKKSILTELKELYAIKTECDTNMQNNSDNYKKYEKIIEDINLYINEVKIEKRNLTRTQLELKPLETKYEEIKLKLSRLVEFQIRKESLENRYENTEIIKNSLDPAKGIPLHLIGRYLKDTELIANDLLDVAYKGRFRIKFDIDDKNFFIKVFMDNGDVKDDINQASQGEVALTTISLSLSMIEQSMTKYNIILLDEIDATLDTTNRINFIEMLENQIEKLNLEQVFVISHNNAFDDYPVNLILLKDNKVPLDDEDYMKDKNIIFNYNE